MKIFLTGMPGSGKTTLGKVLAQKLGIPFIDLDAEVERKEGLSITQLFEQHGEPYFRQAEAAVLREVAAANQSFVMATGGGTPCFYEGIEFMNSQGVTFFLDTAVDVLSKRLDNAQKAKRPLLQTATTMSEALHHLRTARLKFYSQATYRFTDPNVDEMIGLIQAIK